MLGRRLRADSPNPFRGAKRFPPLLEKHSIRGSSPVASPVLPENTPFGELRLFLRFLSVDQSAFR